MKLVSRNTIRFIDLRIFYTKMLWRGALMLTNARVMLCQYSLSQSTGGVNLNNRCMRRRFTLKQTGPCKGNISGNISALVLSLSCFEARVLKLSQISPSRNRPCPGIRHARISGRTPEPKGHVETC